MEGVSVLSGFWLQAARGKNAHVGTKYEGLGSRDTWRQRTPKGACGPLNPRLLMVKVVKISRVAAQAKRVQLRLVFYCLGSAVNVAPAQVLAKKYSVPAKKSADRSRCINIY